MNPGDLLLRLALVTAVLSGVFYFGSLRGRRWSADAWIFRVHALLLVAAFALLCAYFMGHHFEYSYVAQFSSRALAPALTLAAVWAGQEGSILLWATFGALIGLALMRQPGRLARPAMFFLSLAQIGLLVLLQLRSPFALSSATPADGRGLNPLLEDPWMVVHPPVLFLGYAALVVPFALAAAALVVREYREWNRMTWPWALFAVVVLGAGIALGGVWAYKVLGWGGYWGWDPVENASLVPWLVSVALLHGLLIQRTTGSLIRTNLLLACAGWVTVLGGTYLTRSGVLQDFSVHSFADSGINGPLKTILFVFPAIALVLLAARWRTVDAANTRIASVSRESALWLGMITVLVLGALVTIGTTAPLLTALAGKPSGLQAEFYQRVSLPIGIALVLLMGLSPALRWYRQSELSWLAGLLPGIAAALLVTVPAYMLGAHAPGLLALVAAAGLALGVNAVVAVRVFRRGWMYGAGYLGHIGIAVMVLGMALSSTLGKSQRLELAQGQPAHALGYTLTWKDEASDGRGGRLLHIVVQAPNWTLDAHPALLPSPQNEGVIRKPAISGWRELYLSPLELRERTMDSGGMTWFEKGQPLDAGGARYTFKGFRMESGSGFRVHADLEVQKDGRVMQASPAIASDPAGSRAVPAEIPGIGPVTIARIDADRGRVALLLPAAPIAATMAVVDLSTKPFINLVWIGALLAVFGTGLAGLRRATEKATSRGTRTAAGSGPPRPLRGASRPNMEEVAMLPGSSTGRARRAGVGWWMLVGLAALMPAWAGAAGPAAPDTTRPVMFLKETLVTGARMPRVYYESPQALSFVSRTQLREQAPGALGDVLGTLPGVDNSKDSPWEQRPVLRGLAGQRVLVLMDGTPMNSVRGNGPHPSLVDPAQVERIEVVRGPSSVAYGSDALGGVINIITREALPGAGRSLSGSATLGGSTVDQQRTGYLELIPRIGKFSAFLSSGARKAENFEAPSGKVANSQFDDYNALSNLRYQFTERTALKGGWQVYRGRDIGIPGLDIRVPGEIDAYSFPFYERNFAHLTLDHGYRSSWLAGTRARVYWQREHRDFFSVNEVARAQFYNDPYLGLNPVFNPAPGAAQGIVQRQDRYFDLRTWGGQLQLTSIKTKWTRFTAGLDAARDQTGGDNLRLRNWHYTSIGGADSAGATSTRRTASLPRGRFANYGGYLQSEWYVQPQWTLSAGGRYTHYRYRTDFGLNAPAAGPSPVAYFQPKSVDDDAASGSLGLVYTPIRDLHLTANLANGYREPNAQDLFFNGPGSVGTVLGNPDLKPERSVSYDLGLRWGPGPFAISGNAFYTTFDDLINALPVAAGTYQYTNIATATTWGGELEGEWRFLPRWTARSSMSGTVGDITSREAIRKIYGIDIDRVPLELVPPFRGSAALRWSEARDRFWVEGSARGSWRTNRLPPPIPGVGQLSSFKSEWLAGDVFAGARLGAQRLLLGVRNVADRRYRQPLGSLDEPGRSVVASVSTDF